MPLYEYRCSKCSHQFEKIQKFSDPPVTECPKCGGEVEQLLSAPAIQFKGAGWYVTDYAAKSGKAKSGDGKAESKSDSPSETKSESKSETKSSSSDGNSSSSSKSSDSTAKS